jgi:hypothetical protein
MNVLLFIGAKLGRLAKVAPHRVGDRGNYSWETRRLLCRSYPPREREGGNRSIRHVHCSKVRLLQKEEQESGKYRPRSSFGTLSVAKYFGEGIQSGMSAWCTYIR